MRTRRSSRRIYTMNDDRVQKLCAVDILLDTSIHVYDSATNCYCSVRSVRSQRDSHFWALAVHVVTLKLAQNQSENAFQSW